MNEFWCRVGPPNPVALPWHCPPHRVLFGNDIPNRLRRPASRLRHLDISITCSLGWLLGEHGMRETSLDDIVGLTDRLYEAVYDDSRWGDLMGGVRARVS
jgi:hypothetical protein